VQHLVLVSGRGEKEAQECEQIVMQAGTCCALCFMQVFIHQRNDHLPETFKRVGFGNDLGSADAETFIGKAAIVIGRVNNNRYMMQTGIAADGLQRFLAAHLRHVLVQHHKVRQRFRVIQQLDNLQPVIYGIEVKIVMYSQLIQYLAKDHLIIFIILRQ
jgi:hypothetical protein